jgi:hypothetical protein
MQQERHGPLAHADSLGDLAKAQTFGSQFGHELTPFHISRAGALDHGRGRIPRDGNQAEILQTM